MNRLAIAPLSALVLALVAGAGNLALASDRYQWKLVDPSGSQIAAYTVPYGVLTVASVHTTSGCQHGALMPTKTAFSYELKMRTNTTAMCIQVVSDQLVTIFEKGKPKSIHVKTASETQTLTPLSPNQPLPH